ncbi:MAG TPA: succinylglutamate desuccinylase/aspartoacylase family protein [Streptosporangiaceae bacterium]|nr:succinylglutamate desuccinylase/aspartoacylase family protein [Streptosporangiaceae bacterium]
MATTMHRRTLDLAGIDVPVVEATGAQDGPRLTVIAGVHGCEYASMAAVRQWSAGLAGRELRGSVLAVPVLNLPAFRARSPFVIPEDGKNLNRCFPGDPAGTLADRLAHATFTQLIAGSDALIDAHCGDLPEALEPFSLYEAGPSEDRALALAVAYGLGYVIRQEPGPDRAVGGTTSAAAAAAGIPAITAEAGGCGLVERSEVDQHVRGLDRVLAALAMADTAGQDGQEPAGPVRLTKFIWLRCDEAGWWQPTVRPGEQVAQGQLLGTVTSIDGAQELQSITAPVAGVPMFVTTSPAVEADGLLLGLGAR